MCWTKLLGVQALTLISILLVSPSLWAAEFTDDFANGIDFGRWSIESNQPLFSYDDTGGDIFFSKPAGGTDEPTDFMELCLNYELLGDFVVSVEFRDAQIDAIAPPPNGDNVVVLDVIFGQQIFFFARSSEPDWEEVGVWEDPPGVWPDSWHSVTETATEGVLRVERVASTVSAHFNDTLIWESTYPVEPLDHVCLELANHFSRTEAVSVHFDNFFARADVIQFFADGFESGDTSAWSSTVP
jgi:hypothetical protein